MVFNENNAKYRMFAARWRTVYGAIALCCSEVTDSGKDLIK
jgi:hypothetical protein